MWQKSYIFCFLGFFLGDASERLLLLEFTVKVLLLTSGTVFTSGGGIVIVELITTAVVSVGLLLLICSEGLFGDSSDVSLWIEWLIGLPRSGFSLKK